MSAPAITDQSTVTININLSFRLVRAYGKIGLHYYAIAIRNLITNLIMNIPKRILPVKEDRENARLYLIQYEYRVDIGGEQLVERRMIPQIQEQDRNS